MQGTLSRQVYEEGKAKEWPGLGKEVSEICRNIGLPDVNDVEVSKSYVNEVIFNHHYADMKREMEEFRVCTCICQIINTNIISCS